MSNYRRNFLKKASILAMPVVTVSNSSYAADCCDKPMRWDKECDVVVLGAGGAGLHAAIQAHDAGGEVVLCNKSTNSYFSATALCGGLFSAFDSRKQRDENIHDAVEEFTQDMLQYGGYWANIDLLRTYARYSGIVFDWMMDHGLEENFFEHYQEHRNLRAVRQKSYTGKDYINILVSEVNRRSIERYDNCAVIKFFYEITKNKVLGVEVANKNRKMTIRVRRGVVLATGGFIGNISAVDRWVPALGKTGVVLNTAANDGTALMTAVRDFGVPLTHMQFVVGYPNGVLDDEKHRSGTVCRIWYHIAEGAILVDKTGYRFTQETQGICHITPHIATLPGRRHYLVMDKTMWEAVLKKYPAGAFGWDNQRVEVELDKGIALVRANSIQLLAKKAGLNEKGLVAQVAQWNKAVDKGRDDQFGRTGFQRRIEKGPFYLVVLSTYTIISSGGLCCNDRMQVLRWDDEPIGGLYAAGETVGAIHGNSYCGGCANGFAQTSGWVAGRLVMGASLPQVPDRS